MQVLLTRVILAFDLHLYIPISKNDENMARAHKRNRCGATQSTPRPSLVFTLVDGSTQSPPCPRDLAQRALGALLLPEAHGVRG